MNFLVLIHQKIFWCEFFGVTCPFKDKDNVMNVDQHQLFTKP